MKLIDLLDPHKPVQMKRIFDANNKQVSAMRILHGEHLKEHTTPIPAFLICINGKVVYHDEEGLSETLITGDYVNIAPNIKHWIDGVEDSNLLLIK
jgi:quercetin dioxygenase-like cupin family protein